MAGLDRRSFCAGAAVALIAPAVAGCGANSAAALPGSRFFVFGEGDRTKLIYRAGTLTELKTGRIVWRRAVSRENFRASETAVDLVADGETIRLREDDAGVWVGNDLVAFGSKISRPRFDGHRHAARLRALHHEVLVNIVGGAPVPNLFVYRRPWRRDAAMMAMCLARTGNLDLISNWVLGLDTVFDGNAGVEEPDNIGQTMYLLALAKAPKDHPLIGRSLAEAQRMRRGDHIAGSTDGAVHAAYQTLWLKHGLGALGMRDDFHAPWAFDHYRSLAWWAAKGGLPYPVRFRAQTCADYPYLAWAEAHYWNLDTPPLPHVDDFPQTWEANAAAADYAKMNVAAPDWARARVAGPHGWHAAEAFLYLEAQA